MNSSSPASERIATIDILRGLALFGILVVNLGTFRSANPDWRGLDKVVDGLVMILFQGKFLTFYSLLFGVSFALFLRKSPDRSTLWRFAWRSLLLLLIGVLHYVLLWDGDILMEYALAAFLLLPFGRRKPRTALTWGVGMYAVYALLLLVIVFAQAARPPQPSAPQTSVDPSVMPEALAQHGSYAALVQWRFQSVGAFLGEHAAASLLLLGIFLIGVYLGKQGILADPAAHASLIKRLLAWCLPLGLAGNILYAWGGAVQKSLPAVERAAVMVVLVLAPIVLALAYAAGAAWLAARVHWMKVLAAAGRMSLTNYLLQSVLMGFLFYQYGFKLYDRVGPTFSFLLALGLYAAQVALSHWWLRRFRYGPVEWAWRSLTYGKVIRMRDE